MRKFFRKVARAFRHFFQPWQDIDKVRAEVKNARRNASRIARQVPVDQPTKRVDETQAQWVKRRDNKYENSGMLYEDLRVVASKHKTHIITGSQIKKETS